MQLLRVYIILWKWNQTFSRWDPFEVPFSYQFDPVTGENDLNNLLYTLAFLNMAQYLALKTVDNGVPIGSFVCTPGGNDFNVPGYAVASADIVITDGQDKVDKWYGDPDFAVYGAFAFKTGTAAGDTHFVNLPEQGFVADDVSAYDGFHMACKPGVSAVVTLYQSTYVEGSLFIQWSLVSGGPYTTLSYPLAG